MTKVLSDVEGEAGDKGMTYTNFEKKQNTGKSNQGDPLGSNSEIARKLRQYYDELVSDNVPDRFSQLLEELEQQEQPRSKSKED